jgi:hypothetical protein
MTQKDLDLKDTHNYEVLEGGVTYGVKKGEKIVYNVEDHWEDLQLDVVTNKLYDLTFKQYTDRTVSSKFVNEPRANSFYITAEDSIIISDVKQYADNIKTNNKALYYLATYGLTIFQRENNEIVKAMRILEPKVRHTTMVNTIAMYNATNNNCKLANDKTAKYSVRMGDQLLSTISSIALDLKISASTFFRILMYYAIKDSEGFLPEPSINYAKDRLNMFESYLLETVVFYKIAHLSQKVFDEIDRDNKDSIKEFLLRVGE